MTSLKIMARAFHGLALAAVHRGQIHSYFSQIPVAPAQAPTSAYTRGLFRIVQDLFYMFYYYSASNTDYLAWFSCNLSSRMSASCLQPKR